MSIDSSINTKPFKTSLPSFCVVDFSKLQLMSYICNYTLYLVQINIYASNTAIHIIMWLSDVKKKEKRKKLETLHGKIK